MMMGVPPTTSYEVTLTANDGTEAMTQAVMVKVTNVDEKATTGIDLSVVQPREGEVVTVWFADGVGNPFVNAVGVSNNPDYDPGAHRRFRHRGPRHGQR